MKTTLFTCETSAGTFWIRPEPAGRVRLGIGHQQLKSYPPAAAAARAVAERRTGWPAWDESSADLPPRDLDRWKRGVPPSKRRRPAGQGARNEPGDE